MSLIDASQQFDIGASVALRKTMTAVDENLDLAAPPVTRDQTRHLRPAAARHLLPVTAHQSPLPTAELMVVLLAEHLLDPAIHLGLGLAFEPDGLAGIEKRRDLLQIEFLCFVHAGRQSSACHSSPGSSCVGIPLPAQAHLVLDKTRCCTPTWPCGTLYNCPGHLEGIGGISLRGDAPVPSCWRSSVGRASDL